MKLDINALRYLSREDFRVLTAVEMGQKNVSSPCSIHPGRGRAKRGVQGGAAYPVPPGA